MWQIFCCCVTDFSIRWSFTQFWTQNLICFDCLPSSTQLYVHCQFDANQSPYSHNIHYCCSRWYCRSFDDTTTSWYYFLALNNWPWKTTVVVVLIAISSDCRVVVVAVCIASSSKSLRLSHKFFFDCIVRIIELTLVRIIFSSSSI